MEGAEMHSRLSMSWCTSQRSWIKWLTTTCFKLLQIYSNTQAGKLGNNLQSFSLALPFKGEHVNSSDTLFQCCRSCWKTTFSKLEKQLLSLSKSSVSTMTVAKESLHQSVLSAWLSPSLAILRMQDLLNKRMVNIWFTFLKDLPTWHSVTLVLSLCLASQLFQLWTT